MPEFSNDQIINALLALPEDTFDGIDGLAPRQRAAIRTMYAKHPEYIKLVARLATSGSEAARSSVVENLGVSVNNQIEATKLEKFHSAGRDEDYDSFSLTPNMTMARNEISFYWSFHNVAVECGNNRSEQLLRNSGGTVVEPLLYALRREHDDVYWRGISALYFSTVQNWSLIDISQYEEFIDWAGQNGDVKSVVDTARERKTNDVQTLRYLVDENKSHSAISKGTL